MYRGAHALGENCYSQETCYFGGLTTSMAARVECDEGSHLLGIAGHEAVEDEDEPILGLRRVRLHLEGRITHDGLGMQTRRQLVVLGQSQAVREPAVRGARIVAHKGQPEVKRWYCHQCKP